MGRPPKRIEDLSPSYIRKTEGMSETERIIHRARQADHVYYSGVRKRVKMSNEYMHATAEMRERLLADAVRSAEEWRTREKRTWQQKAEAMGFTRNTNGEWEQNLKILCRASKSHLKSNSMDACEKEVQEKESLSRSNPSLTTIMVCLSELGGNLNRGELDIVERKVLDLINSHEEQNPPISFTPLTMPITADSVEPGPQKRRTDELDSRKRKRSSSCELIEHGNEGIHVVEKSSTENPARDSWDSWNSNPGGGNIFEIPEPPSVQSGIHDADLAPRTERQHIASENIDRGDEGNFEAEQPGLVRASEVRVAGRPAIERPAVKRPIIQRPTMGELAAHTPVPSLFSGINSSNGTPKTSIDINTTEVKLEGKLEGTLGIDAKMPIRTGFFDHIKWDA